MTSRKEPDTLRINFEKVFGFDPGVLEGEKRRDAKRLLHGYNYGMDVIPVGVTDRLKENS